MATQTAIIQDEDVSIKCEVQGDPPLHISWKRKGLDINVALNSQFTVSLEWTHREKVMLRFHENFKYSVIKNASLNH